MADATGISWAHSTFNPWLGCEKVSPGCARCYAEVLVTGKGPGKLNRPGTWGPDGVRQRTAPSTWAKPRTWERQAEQFAEANDGQRRRVFCASLADVFEPRPELIPWRAELFALIRETPSLDWLILTKRPAEARDWIDRLYGDAFPEVYPNVWLGTSIENARHTYRADELRECRVALRFLSCEPLLGSLYPGPDAGARHGAMTRDRDAARIPAGVGVRAALNLDGIGWVIVGGESGGRDARPMHPRWPREIRDHVLSLCGPCHGDGQFDGHVCTDHRPSLHMKQWGAWAERGVELDRRPDDLVVEPDGSHRRSDVALPSPDSAWMRYAGPRPTSGGKYLDGDDWCEVPPSPYVPERLFA